MGNIGGSSGGSGLGGLTGILGGGGTAGSGGGSTSTDIIQATTLTPGQRSLLDQMTTLLGEQFGKGMPAYSGQTVAPLSNLQQQGIDFYGGMIPTAQQGANIFSKALQGYDANAGQNYLNQANPALNSMLADYNPASDKEYWQSAFVNPAMQNYQRNIMPQLLEKYAGQGAGSSGAMNRAIANSGVDLSTNMNAQLANLMYQGRNAQLGRQQTGINQAMNMAQMPGQLAQQAGQIGAMGMDTMGQAMNAGALQQQNTQQNLTAEQQKWLQSQAYNNPWLNTMGLALGTPAFENVANVQQSAPSASSSFMPLLGSFMGSGMGQDMMGGLFSGLMGGGMGGDTFGGAASMMGGFGASGMGTMFA
ncbi:MAG: hypothetical protein WC356_02715 [Candidatus Micrarchaeia archaeon]|jgi:hypothetical protein